MPWNPKTLCFLDLSQSAGSHDVCAQIHTDEVNSYPMRFSVLTSLIHVRFKEYPLPAQLRIEKFSSQLLPQRFCHLCPLRLTIKIPISIYLAPEYPCRHDAFVEGLEMRSCSFSLDLCLHVSKDPSHRSVQYDV